MGSKRQLPLPRRRTWALGFVALLLIVGFLFSYTDLVGLDESWNGWTSPEVPVNGMPVDQGEDLVVVPRISGRILITGGGGNIGKLLVRRLLQARNKVTVIDLIFHQDELDAIHNEVPHSSTSLRVVYGDIRDPIALGSAMTSDVAGVIHLAAVSRVGWCLENEADCVNVNVGGTEAVLKAMESAGLGAWFIQASSREVYGNADTFPVNEATPHRPANVYGQTKSDAEEVVRRHHYPTILLRLSNVYGGIADHRERLIPAIVSNALSHRIIQMVGGHQDLDMVHIDDVVRAFTLALDRLNSASADLHAEAYNIGTGSSVSAMDIIQKVIHLTNSSSPLQVIPGDARFPDHYIGSTTKAVEQLNFRAEVQVDEGLLRLVTAFYESTLSFVKSTMRTACANMPSYTSSDLLALDGCTGSVGVDSPDGIQYLTTDPESGSLPAWTWLDTDEVQSWNFEFVDAGTSDPIVSLSQHRQGRQLYFEAVEEGHLLGAQRSFSAAIEPSTGYVTLRFKSHTPFVPSHLKDARYRFTPFCCPGKPAPWPFFAEDPMASAISDTRTGTYRFFNASQHSTACRRLEMAKDIAQTRLTSLGQYNRPITLARAPLPTGQPHEWRVRGLEHCPNYCDHPTTCLDTGECACTQSACISRVRYPFSAFANVTGLSFPPPTINWDEVETNDPLILIRKVAASSWLNVLRPSARRYLQSTPPWPAINLTRMPDAVQENRDTNWGDFDKLQSTPHGCFSADSVLERGVKLLSQDYQPDSLVFMPYFAGTQMMPPVEPWIDNALARHLPSDFDSTRLIVPFTFDWGVCNTVLHDLWRVRDWSSVNERMLRISSWQPMGDLNSPCYRIDQDIVIPSRTCLQDRLRSTFGDLNNVLPSRKRSILVAFKGSLNGAGSALRQKLTCPRTLAADPRLSGGQRLSILWNDYKPGSDYLGTIGDSVFCPLPGGTTGWATRTIDVIYAGCIPVLFGDQTHHPFWDVLDWTKFAIFIPDDQVNRLEEILLDFSWLDVIHLQTNLMLIRDAFLYPTEPRMETNLEERGPFFYAMHSTALLRKTRYPILAA